MTHLYPSSLSGVSYCGGEVRDKALGSLREPSPLDVPVRMHHSQICSTCLYIAEVGPVDKGNNRVVPVICGIGLSESQLR